MTKRKKIKKLINNISNKKLKSEDIKLFSSTMIELMAESGIPPRTRREFFLYTQTPSPDVGRIIEFAEDAMGLMLEKA